MKHSVNDIVAHQFTRSLRALKGILQKASAHAKERGYDENLFLQLRLAPDMFPFSRQVQIATDIAKGAVSRLAGKDAPVFPDEEKTLAELMARVDRTVEFLASVKEEDFKDYHEKKVSFPYYPGKYLMGGDYLVSHAVPNFYFHLTTVYALLRANGVHLGKGDFLGEQNWQKES